MVLSGDICHNLLTLNFEHVDIVIEMCTASSIHAMVTFTGNKCRNDNMIPQRLNLWRKSHTKSFLLRITIIVTNYLKIKGITYTTNSTIKITLGELWRTLN